MKFRLLSLVLTVGSVLHAQPVEQQAPTSEKNAVSTEQKQEGLPIRTWNPSQDNATVVAFINQLPQTGTMTLVHTGLVNKSVVILAETTKMFDKELADFSITLDTKGDALAFKYVVSYKEDMGTLSIEGISSERSISFSQKGYSYTLAKDSALSRFSLDVATTLPTIISDTTASAVTANMLRINQQELFAIIIDLK